MRRVIVCMAVIIFFRGENLLADGFMLLPSITYGYTGKEKVSSDAQKALIVWHEGEETLHIQSSYSGPASDFAWVIPIPSRPAVKRSSWSLFKQAEEATRPRITVEKGVIFPGFKFGCSAPEVEVRKETLPTGVRELESLDIRELHIDIVEASDSGGFLRWLRNHEYAVDEKAEPVLQRYIDANFYFIVTKISKSSTWAKRKGVTETVSGGLTPLAITFAAEKAFYPLAISTISSAPENELLLLTAAPQRLEPVEYGCTTLSHEDIEKTIAPKLRESGNVLFTTLVDFAPAIKAAQNRLEKPALVVECVAEMAWQGNNYSKLVSKKALFAGEHLRITRFHTFLKPEEMKDITFLSAAQDKLFEGRFYIGLRHRYENTPHVNASAGIMMLGLISAVASKRKAWSRRNLQKIALILLLVGLVLS